MMEDQGCGPAPDSRNEDMDSPAVKLDEMRWSAIVAALPPLVRARALNGVRTRSFLEGVLWVAVTQQPWGRLPKACGPWHSVYVRFTRWTHEGIWDVVIASLNLHPDIADPLRRLVSAYRNSNHPASSARRAMPRYQPF